MAWPDNCGRVSMRGRSSHQERGSLCDTAGMDAGSQTERPQRLTVSLKTLAVLLDADRASVRRWLCDAGIKPVAMGRGRNGAIRYRWCEIEDWLESRETVE